MIRLTLASAKLSAFFHRTRTVDFAPLTYIPFKKGSLCSQYGEEPQ